MHTHTFLYLQDEDNDDAYMYTYIHIYIHMYIHTYIHIIHTYIYNQFDYISHIIIMILSHVSLSTLPNTYLPMLIFMYSKKLLTEKKIIHYKNIALKTQHRNTHVCIIVYNSVYIRTYIYSHT